MTFNNRNSRDRSTAQMESVGTSMGFTVPNPSPFPGQYTGGMERIGTTAARFCYTHTDEAVVDAALAALNDYFAANGRLDGIFGSQRISD